MGALGPAEGLPAGLDRTDPQGLARQGDGERLLKRKGCGIEAIGAWPER